METVMHYVDLVSMFALLAFIFISPAVIICLIVDLICLKKRLYKAESTLYHGMKLFLDKSTTIVGVKKLVPEAKLPTFKHLTDAGADVSSIEKVTIEPGGFATIRTGLSVELKVGHELQFRPRSGLSSKGILGVFGTVDAGYRGEIKGIIYNFSKEPFTIESGDRIAQVVVKPTEIVTFTEVKNLSESDRGEGGFGSTGVKS